MINKYEIISHLNNIIIFGPFNTLKRIKFFFMYIFFDLYRKEYRKIISVRKSFIGQDCLILGNGPSLLVTNFEEQRNKDIFVVNYFHKVDKSLNLRPRHYVIIDNEFQLGLFESETYKILFDWVYSNPDCNLYLNFKSKSVILSHFGYIPKNVFLIPNEYFFTDYSFLNRNYILYKTVNVVAYAILLATYMGYNDIHLSGLDYGLGYHAYKINPSNTFYKSYLDQGFYYHSLLMRTYRKISNFAHRNNIEITNLSVDSTLTPFKGLDG